MKRFLFFVLAIVICASSLAACTDRKANEPDKPKESSAPAQSTSSAQNASTAQSSKPAQSASTAQSSKPAQSSTPAQSSKPEEPVRVDLSKTNDKFFNSLDYFWLEYAVFDVYKTEVSDIDTEPAYYIETMQYDEATKTAVVQVPCQKDGSLKCMTITMVKSADNKWEKKTVEYTVQPNTENLVGGDNEFITQHYPDVQSIAFKFLRAYIQADKATAVKIINGGENNLCLSYFNNTDKGSLKDIKSVGFELNKYEYNEKTGKGSAVIDVHFATKDDDSIQYMTMMIDTVDEKDATGKVTKNCTVYYFGIEA